MALKKRGRDPEALQIIQEAMLCKIFRCRPSELDNENFERILLYSLVYQQIGEKNPLMFM